MAWVYEDECVAMGLDPKAVQRIANRMDRVAADAHKLGLVIFGGSGSGSLRFTDDGGSRTGAATHQGQVIVATLNNGSWDGGDGGFGPGDDGLMRGE